jgi:hypothetical protein
MIDEIGGDDWTRIAGWLGLVRDRLQDGTRCILPGSDCITVEVSSWVATVNELRRIQRQCEAYGEMHCPRVPDMPNAQARQTPERSVGGMVPPVVGNSGQEDRL